MGERQKEMWRKLFRRDNLIVLVLAGVLLFVIALPTEKKGDSGQKAAGMSEAGASPGTKAGDEAGMREEEFAVLSADYAEQQEKKLAEILASMDGVGKVEVMLTIAVSEELVVEKDTKVSRSNVDETDSAGGSRVSSQTETEAATIYSTGDGDNHPYVVKTLNPRVEGVVVVAEGAGNGTVNRQITQIVQALFGVEAHRVKVVPMG